MTSEDIDIKQSVFEDLDVVCRPNTVLVSNTDTLSIMTIADATDRPEQVLELHFMNPVPVMDGVELVVGEKTSNETTILGRELAHGIGKETWEADDKPGFVVTGAEHKFDDKGRPTAEPRSGKVCPFTTATNSKMSQCTRMNHRDRSLF